MALPRDPVELLLASGASRDEAQRIVEPLEAVGMRRPRIRAWLAHPQLAYPMVQAVFDVAGRPFEYRNAPIFAVEDGGVEHVIELARRFAAAPAEQREVSLAFACTLETVEHQLAHGQRDRLEDLAAVARLLSARLPKPVHVADFPGWTFDGDFKKHFADWLADDRLAQVRRDLESGALDPLAIWSDPSFVTSTWEANPSGAPSTWENNKPA